MSHHVDVSWDSYYLDVPSQFLDMTYNPFVFIWLNHWEGLTLPSKLVVLFYLDFLILILL
jgi:hypothetical protein